MKKRKKSKTTKTYLKKLEKRERNRLDQEWRDKIRLEFNNKCAVCDSDKFLNAHHLIPREIAKLRHEILNGVLLCPSHHKYSNEISAHKNPLIFLIFYSTHYKERYDKLVSIIPNFKLDSKFESINRP